MVARRFMAAVVFGFALVGGLATARAQAPDRSFQVDPTRVDLSTGDQTAALVITNHGTAPLRLQLTAQGWQDDIDGVMQLVPTTAVVVRPSLVEVAPGRTRTVRVGLTTASTAVEQSYRLFVEQLPDRRVALGGRIEVLTRIGVPVFVAPTVMKTAGVVAPAVVGGVGVVTVSNAGTVHTKLASVKLSVRTNGRERWVREVAGWYVLAGAQRKFAVELGGERCERGEQMVAEVVGDGGVRWSGSASCEP